MAERKSFLLRIDPQVWSEIEAWAQADLRSVNGQIEFILREAVQRRRSRNRFAQEGPPNRNAGSESSSSSASPSD